MKREIVKVAIENYFQDRAIGHEYAHGYMSSLDVGRIKITTRIIVAIKNEAFLVILQVPS